MMVTHDLFVSALNDTHGTYYILNTVLGQLSAGIVVIDLRGVVLVVNRMARDMLESGGDIEEGTTWAALCKRSELRSFDRLKITPESDPLFMAQRENRSIAKRLLIVTLESRSERWVSVTAFPILNKEGALIASGATIVDITDFKGMQDVLYHQATHDSLTGLSNRAFFFANLSRILARAKRNKAGGAIAVMDLDNFKKVNDTMGHAMGDELLIRVAERLTAEVRETDVVARIGGDEFSILLQDLEGQGDEVAAGNIASRICEALARPFSIFGRSLQITASIGISLFPIHGTDEAVLLAGADMAMYQVKKQGGNGWKFWHGEGSDRSGGVPFFKDIL